MKAVDPSIELMSSYDVKPMLAAYAHAFFG